MILRFFSHSEFFTNSLVKPSARIRGFYWAFDVKMSHLLFTSNANMAIQKKTLSLFSLQTSIHT